MNLKRQIQIWKKKILSSFFPICIFNNYLKTIITVHFYNLDSQLALLIGLLLYKAINQAQIAITFVLTLHKNPTFYLKIWRISNKHATKNENVC